MAVPVKWMIELRKLKQSQTEETEWNEDMNM